MKLAKQQETLVEALEKGSLQHFLEVLSQHSGKAAEVDVKELLQTLPAKLQQRLCKGLSHKVAQAVQALCTPEQSLDGDGGGDEDMDGDDSAVAAEALKGVALLSTALLVEHGRKVPDALLEAAAALHDSALLALQEWPEVQEAVAKLCLAWWSADAPGKEALVAQTLPYLLLRGLATGKAADVKRCHSLRAALGLLDFEDVSISDLKRLLLRAAFSPAFLRPAEGRRFLAHLFTLEPQMVRELGAIVRNQIPAARASVLSAYGEVLFRALRDAGGACAYEVEALVQDLAQAAVLARTPQMSAALRGVLNGLHREKAAPGVDALLLRLYQPIVFRGLAAANAAVRRNALALLLDAFPLQDPDTSNEEALELLNRQFACLGDALRDAAPAVRAAAVAGMCRLLNAYWEIIPSPVIAGFLQRIAGELAFDAGAVGVRCAALEGLAALAQNPLAQPLLAALLPGLRPLLWDASPAVQITLADLLLSVGTVRGLSFVDIAPLDALLEALAAEPPEVAQRLYHLLAPSYFPGREEGPACVAALLRQSPAAGVAFCRMMAQQQAGTPLDDVLVLAATLRDHLLACPPAGADAGAAPTASGAPARSAKRKKKKGGAPESPNGEGNTQAAESPDAWLAMLEGLAALCQGLAAACAAGDLDPDQAAGLFSGSHLPRLLALCTGPEARSAALAIAAALPDGAGLHVRSITHLLASSACSAAELRNGLLCVAGVGDLDGLLEDLGAALDPDRLAAGTPEDAHMSAASALRCLGAMLEDEALRLSLLSSNAMPLLLQRLRALSSSCTAALAGTMLQREWLQGDPHARELHGDEGEPPAQAALLALPALAVSCRAALHLQLTSALVATATSGQHTTAWPSEAGKAEGAEKEGAAEEERCGDGIGEAQPAHMWSAVGQEALEEALTYAKWLQEAMNATWLMAEEEGEQPAAEQQPPERPAKRWKKGRVCGADPASDVPSMAALHQVATQVVLSTVALAADAVQLFPYAALSQRSEPAHMSSTPAEKMCRVANALVAWTTDNDRTPSERVDVAAAALGHAARLAAAVLNGQQGEPVRDLGASTAPEFTPLAARLMEVGVRASEAWAAAALKPHLASLLSGLCSLPCAAHNARWLQPLAAAAWEELSAAAAGAPHSKPVEDCAENQNVPSNLPGRKMGAGPLVKQPLVKAVLQAASTAKVQPALAQLAAEAGAAAIEACDWELAARAVRLISLIAPEGLKGRAGGLQNGCSGAADRLHSAWSKQTAKKDGLEASEARKYVHAWLDNIEAAAQ